MRIQTPPLAPSEPASDSTIHIVLDEFGELGRAYVETYEAQADENSVIENILSGRYSNPLRVVAFNTVEGWARDVTEDVAIAVLSRARSEHRSIGKRVREFLERALGVNAPRDD
jgi:hypothetical protein